ncbi:MAG: VanZ family protein, partial [Endomicrobiia bacterium]|nr:VanZ family protein [Endomicrobiia bacterium]
FYFSSIPNLRTEFGIWDIILRKVAHVAVFAALFIFARSAFTDTFGEAGVSARILSVSATYLWPALFSIIYAVSDEYHQTFVVGRVGSFWDVMIDTSGICAAAYMEMKGHIKKFAMLFTRTK